MILATVTITRELDEDTAEMVDTVEAVDGEGDCIDAMEAAGMCALAQHKILAGYLDAQDDDDG